MSNAWIEFDPSHLSRLSNTSCSSSMRKTFGEIDKHQKCSYFIYSPILDSQQFSFSSYQHVHLIGYCLLFSLQPLMNLYQLLHLHVAAMCMCKGLSFHSHAEHFMVTRKGTN